ncbi:MAG: transketolase family protein [Clostridia bacterium]|nr:transketolase family protein [Clostridia bacterium]MBR0326827.1 transketolase family protein [Clostridia bacterium]
MADKKATREALGDELTALGAVREDLVVLTADLADATRVEYFRHKYPERFIECGIAEANMMGVAAGLAATGKVAVASSFAMFAAGRAFEQIRNSIGYTELNVKIAATHAGVSVGEDGASHQCNEDIALMRTIPGMTVINPADYTEARTALRAAVEMNGPCYIRFGRAAVPDLSAEDENYSFEIGKGRLLSEGKDVTVIASGLTVAMALEAKEILKADGIDAEIINIHTIKPLDTELVCASAKKTGCVVTAEEHNIIGGLGSAVAEALSENCPVIMRRVGVEDVWGKSGSAGALLDIYGISAANIAAKAKEAYLAKKNG